VPELGCGLGLVAVTAAHNGVTLQVAVCAFEEPGPLLAGAPWDLVLAADVLYEPRNVPVLRGATKRLQTNTNRNEFG
jgi:hypothetical protein